VVERWIGVATAPVGSSAPPPAWIAFVSKCMRRSLATGLQDKQLKHAAGRAAAVH
jgi:hypothetical protein